MCIKWAAGQLCMSGGGIFWPLFVTSISGEYRTLDALKTFLVVID